MINLLPPDAKRSVIYARQNSQLLRWVVAMSLSVVVVAVVVAFGLLYINQSISDNQKQLTETQQQLKIQKLEDTQKRVQDISGSLKLVSQVLSKEVLFSKLLQQIG